MGGEAIVSIATVPGGEFVARLACRVVVVPGVTVTLVEESMSRNGAAATTVRVRFAVCEREPLFPLTVRV
jgi:hypothetical protein